MRTYIVMAYVVMAYIVMAYIVMAYIVMAYIVMAYIVYSLYSYGLYSYGDAHVSRDGARWRRVFRPSLRAVKLDLGMCGYRACLQGMHFDTCAGICVEK